MDVSAANIQEVRPGHGELFRRYDEVKRRLIGVTTAVLGTMLLSGVGLQTAAAADPVVPTEVMLPLFGAQLTFTITTGPGGALSDVSVDNADRSDRHTASAAQGRLRSRQHHRSDCVPARSSSVRSMAVRVFPPVAARWPTCQEPVRGAVTCSAMALPAASSSPLASTDDTPDITGISTTGADAVVGDVQHSTGDDDEGTESSAKVTIKFTNEAGDMSRSLTIRVKVETDADSNSSAKVTVALGRLRGVAVAAADAAGPHTWNGVLCDGTAAMITYDVAADGTVSNVVATPAADRVKADGGKIEVRFTNKERVRIRVREHDGQITINVDERIRCDSPNPTTNAATTSSVARR